MKGDATLQECYKLELPPGLRVGTLDSLLELSDDLVRISSGVDGTATKLRRQLEEIGRDQGDGGMGITVDGRPVEHLLESFAWDEARHPSRRPLRETVDKIVEATGKLEDELKVKLAEYTQAKQSLQQVVRKSQGSLMVKDLAPIVKPNQVLETENLTSLFVVINKSQVKEFVKAYEKVLDFPYQGEDGAMKRMFAVVPRSAGTPIAVDQEYALYRVVAFAKMADEVKHKYRELGFQVREFKLNPDAEAHDEELARLEREVQKMSSGLHAWCGSAYGEAAQCWLHLVAIRLFVESILRYGLPPRFQGVVMKPSGRTETKLRKGLAANFGTTGAVHWKEGAFSGDDSKAGPGMDNETFPYVSLTVDFQK